MNEIIYRSVVSIVLIVLLLSCHESESRLVWKPIDAISFDNDVSVDESASLLQPEGYRSVITNGKNANGIEWRKYKSAGNEISFSAPSSWTPGVSPDAEVFLAIDSIHRDFFTLMINKKSTIIGNAKDHFLSVVNGVKKEIDSTYMVNDYSYLSNRTRDVYYIDMVASSHKQPIFLVVVTESSDYVFDFTMRYTGEDKILARATFNILMASFKINGTSVLGPEANLDLVDIGWKIKQ